MKTAGLYNDYIAVASYNYSLEMKELYIIGREVLNKMSGFKIIEITSLDMSCIERSC